jgi:hypothetical protein
MRLAARMSCRALRTQAGASVMASRICWMPYSIRINDQWRVCFRWTESGAEDVEIVDYH